MLKEISLSGKWGFVIDPQDRGIDWCQYHIKDPIGAYPAGAGDLHDHFEDLLLDEVTVPGSWQMYKPEYKWYQGTAFFFKMFSRPEIEPGQRAFIHFEGISFRARVWLNGHEINGIDYPYLPFESEITSLLEDENYLVLRIEGNSRPDDTLPQFGWMNYAGIVRPVKILITGRKRLSLVLLDPEICTDKAQGRLKIRLNSDLGFGAGEKLVWKLRGNGLNAEGKIDIFENGNQREFEIPWQDVGFWQPGNPLIYDFRLSWCDINGVELDIYEKAIGFREFTVRNGKFILNGHEIFLRGIGRHNIHPDYGMSLTSEAIKQDISMVVELGCNFIRLPHYPQDTAVLEECDRQGLLTWVEIPVYWNSPLENRKTQQQMHQQLEAMVRRDYNHPSVVIWSMANEIHSDRAEILECFRKAREMIRSYDAVRPITFASWPKEAGANLGLKMVDACCLNRYCGWYEPNCDLIAGELDEIRQLYPDKPVLLSEFGAGARPGFHDQKSCKWSEEYQSELIEKILNIARKHSCGCSIWNFADFADPSRVSMKISNGLINNKGLVSEDRKYRKLAFNKVKNIYVKWKADDGQ